MTRQQKWKKANPDKVRNGNRAWSQANKGKEQLRCRRYYIANRDKEISRLAKYRKDNSDYYIEKAAERKATKLNATPSWADKEVIQDKYEFCKLWSELVGRKYHVDHIVPLKNKLVCGLHVPDNLRVITAKENLEKHNIFIIQEFS